MQIGAGYDIPLSTDANKTQFVLSPFVSFQPYFGQNPRSTETWNNTTVRAGVALKFGQGKTFKRYQTDKQVSFSVDSLVMFLEILNLLRYFHLETMCILTMDPIPNMFY
jgi:hypothetical protein